MKTQQSLIKLPSKALITGLLVAGLTLPSMSFSQSFDAHHKDYQAALEIVASSEANILNAMQQVQSGQVAHYDFLQYELIELIRHSRALAWPPGSVPTSTKTAISDEARALRNSAEELEWIITDFLRAIAQVRSATSNTLDIAKQAILHASGSTKTDLQALQVETLKFMGAAYQEGWQQLESAFDSALKGDISAQSYRELSFQKAQLATYPQQLSGFMKNLTNSDVDERAAKLKALYEAAI